MIIVLSILISLSLYIYTYMYTCVCIYIYIYIYIHLGAGHGRGADGLPGPRRSLLCTSCHTPVPFGMYDNSMAGGRLVCRPYYLARGHIFISPVPVPSALLSRSAPSSDASERSMNRLQDTDVVTHTYALRAFVHMPTCRDRFDRHYADWKPLYLVVFPQGGRNRATWRIPFGDHPLKLERCREY